MDRDDLISHFVTAFFYSGGVTITKLEKQGFTPQHFARAITSIAQRHGVLSELQGLPSWRGVAVYGNWDTSALAADAALLGVTILEIEAVYRLTYGGKS